MDQEARLVERAGDFEGTPIEPEDEEVIQMKVSSWTPKGPIPICFCL